MDFALLVARLVLAAVFFVSGFAKLFDREGSRQAVADFGVPPRLAGPIGALLPLLELAVAVLLLPVATAWWGGLGALALLGVFSAGIGYNLARGRTPDCHCFGQLHSAPIGRSTLVRNGVLAAVALFLVVGGYDDAGSSAVAWIGDLSTFEAIVLVGGLILAALLAAEAWTLVHLLGQNGRLLVRLDALEEALAAGGIIPRPADAAQPEAGLPVGSPAPNFRLAGLHGETMTLEALTANGKPVMLFFSDPNCGPCNALLPDIGIWQRDFAAAFNVALISRGKPEANRAKTAEHGIATVLLQKDREVAQSFQVHGTPAAVLVRPDRTIGSPVALGSDAIRGLVQRTVNPALAPARVPAPSRVGQPAPPIELPDLEGKTVKLADFRGEPTLVLFWNPGCGFCRRMLDDLKAWEANPQPGAPKLLVVSTGDVEANKEMGIKSPVVLDKGFQVGRAYGAGGTPSAVLVDAEGKIASEVGVGAPAVLALARGEALPTAGNGAVPAGPPAPKVGAPAPALKLPDLSGSTIDLADLRGTKTMVLFWNPGCGFCRQMLDDLKAWEAKPPKGAPKLLVVSAGSVEENAAQGFRSPVVLDQGFAVGRAFGAAGTPTAVLVNARGKIASEPAVGADAVLQLAGARRGRPSLRPASA